MTTKLSRFFSGLMEAAWLAAVSLVPVFFNIYSNRIFEPDKITLLRSLALITLGAWILKLIDDGGIKWKDEYSNIPFYKYLLKFPMVVPVIGLIAVYIISTIFSVTPSISLFGSYQRLQGTYTTFSYLIIFFAIVTNLRTRSQINRLITTVIFASVPICLYGLLQRYQIDPIPWGGNVSVRIASNMGNSIFVAAYMIMVFPLTLGKMIESFRNLLRDDPDKNSLPIAKSIVSSTIYVFIAALELIAIYMSGSRGPLLGLMAEIYVLLLLLSIYWKKRIVTIGIVSIALLGVIFLAVFNINNGPLESLKKSPAIGRFGLLLDPESNSALVRQYIWEGTVKLVGPHQPIKFPDGSNDKFNFLRILFGYGPESMYVAYNQFYQPELGRVEKRNASPDRAHNETWDSIVITGVVGLLVYLSVFCTIFYYGLSWQNLITNNREKYIFLICMLGGGIVGSVVLIRLKGIEYFGVGLPFGIIIGVVLYLTIYALFSKPNAGERYKSPYSILLIILFSAIVGHLVEINFGIAIAATRTLFWSYTGLLIVIGFILPQKLVTSDHLLATETLPDGEGEHNYRKKEKRLSRKPKTTNRDTRPIFGNQPIWVRKSLIGSFIVGIVLTTLSYNYVTNTGHSTSFIGVIIDSLSRLPNKNNAFSLGVLVLIMVTWIIGVLLFSSEDEIVDADSWVKNILLIALVSFMIGFIFLVLHAISLAVLAGFKPENQNDVLSQVNSISALLTKYYVFLFLIFIFAALLLPEEWVGKRNTKSATTSILSPVILIILTILINITNLKVIHADITFKMADPFSKSNQWQAATFLYKSAIDLAPKEDHYYLFIGRSYLEQAKITESTEDQDNLILQAENDLKVAQKINPLNTDHTANLARLYSWWAGKASNDTIKGQRAQKASNYYSTAVTLSPNNSTIWDEWAVLYMQVFGNTQEAYQKITHAMELDPSYSFTQGLMGDYYYQIANSTNDINSKKQSLVTAANYYKEAARLVKSTDATPRSSYLVTYGNVYLLITSIDPKNVDHEQLQAVIDTLISSMEAGVRAGDKWKVQEVVAKLFEQIGNKYSAQYYADLALKGAPSSYTDRIKQLITQINAMP